MVLLCGTLLGLRSHCLNHSLVTLHLSNWEISTIPATPRFLIVQIVRVVGSSDYQNHVLFDSKNRAAETAVRGSIEACFRVSTTHHSSLFFWFNFSISRNLTVFTDFFLPFYPFSFSHKSALLA